LLYLHIGEKRWENGKVHQRLLRSWPASIAGDNSPSIKRSIRKAEEDWPTTRRLGPRWSAVPVLGWLRRCQLLANKSIAGIMIFELDLMHLSQEVKDSIEIAAHQFRDPG
jgi:hypothetical protein